VPSGQAPQHRTFGDQVVAGLLQSTDRHKFDLQVTDRAGAMRKIDKADVYGAIVIPRDFTSASLLLAQSAWITAIIRSRGRVVTVRALLAPPPSSEGTAIAEVSTPRKHLASGFRPSVQTCRHPPRRQPWCRRGIDRVYVGRDAAGGRDAHSQPRRRKKTMNSTPMSAISPSTAG
jgi:hypothetical protein